MDSENLPGCHTDLVRLLVLEAGRIMEDASADFAEALPTSRPSRATRLAFLLGISETVHQVLKAAQALEQCD